MRFEKNCFYWIMDDPSEEAPYITYISDRNEYWEDDDEEILEYQVFQMDYTHSVEDISHLRVVKVEVPQ